ncbi:MAG: DUF2497 domain-containing protein [Erythrobacter sp.]
MAQHGEASVEEILESIKKVIARDNRMGAAAPQLAEPAPEPDDGAESESDVLDLATMEFAHDLVRQADASVEYDMREHGYRPDDGDGSPPLTTESVRKSMRENFEALAMLAEPGARPQIVRSGETSLEGLVRDLLRPMLAEWLDKNLPTMVEKLVQAEIARIAGKRG